MVERYFILHSGAYTHHIDERLGVKQAEVPTEDLIQCGMPLIERSWIASSLGLFMTGDSPGCAKHDLDAFAHFPNTLPPELPTKLLLAFLEAFLEEHTWLTAKPIVDTS